LRKIVDTLIVVPNQRLLSLAAEIFPFLKPSKKQMISFIRLLKGFRSDHNSRTVQPGFADVKSVMSEMELALMGRVRQRKNRAVEAAQKAISSRP
jgi:cell division protein FtsZ